MLASCGDLLEEIDAPWWRPALIAQADRVRALRDLLRIRWSAFRAKLITFGVVTIGEESC
jgi:hypothetical protein